MASQRPVATWRNAKHVVQKSKVCITALSCCTHNLRAPLDLCRCMRGQVGHLPELTPEYLVLRNTTRVTQTTVPSGTVPVPVTVCEPVICGATVRPSVPRYEYKLQSINQSINRLLFGRTVPDTVPGAKPTIHSRSPPHPKSPTVSRGH